MGFGVFEPTNRDLPAKVELSGPFAFLVGSAKAMINAAVIAMKVLFQIAEFERIIGADMAVTAYGLSEIVKTS
jgi:hypothetical protein